MLYVKNKSILYLLYFTCLVYPLKAQKIGVSFSARTTYLKNETYDSAQLRTIHFANLLGNTNKVIGKFEPVISYDIGLKTVLVIGKLRIEPELKYCINKTKLNKPNFSNINNAYTTLNLKNNLIEFNCLVHEYISKKVFLLIGPSVQAKISSSIDDENRLIESTNILGYGLKGGFGIDLLNNVTLQLTDQFSKNAFVITSSNIQGHTPALTAIYWFKRKVYRNQ